MKQLVKKLCGTLTSKEIGFKKYRRETVGTYVCGSSFREIIILERPVISEIHMCYQTEDNKIDRQDKEQKK